MASLELAKGDLCSNKFVPIKYSWKSLAEIINGQHFDRLSRSVSQEIIYTKYNSALKRNWRSTHDFILHTKFKYDVIVAPRNSYSSSLLPLDFSIEPDEVNSDEASKMPPSGCQWAARKPANNSKVPDRLIVKNDFPYYFEDGIEHWILWKQGDLAKSDIEWGVERLQNEKKYDDILHWINPTHLRSLPDIDHAHIVCVRR